MNTMALFNESSQIKATVDDTEKLACTVENAQNINNHTEYTLRVQRGPSKENRWNVSRRYRDFAALHAVLQQSNIELPLPPKKLIGNMQPTFIAERQVALQNYINEVLKHQILSLSLQVRSFLDPSNYSTAFAGHCKWIVIGEWRHLHESLQLIQHYIHRFTVNHRLEQALQTVSIALRGDGRYELKGPLHNIGWRIRKHYFLVTDTASKVKCMLAWQNYGPDRCLCDKDLQTAFKSLQSLSHPYIDQILAIHNLETGAYIVRRIHENGTIRDILYGTEYSKSYLSKYGNPRVRKPFTKGQISHYGYQILQALKFLHEKGLPHGHIHPGNIAIENQRVQLLDVENILLGGASLYRPHLLHLRRINAEGIDVYCFARTLYEMAYAMPLEEYYCDDYPDIDIDLESVLRICLSTAACKHGQPSIDELLQHMFFYQAPLNGLSRMNEDSRSHLKFPIALKEELRNVVTCSEARLRSDQKLERTARREIRIQEILGSEEEMKKQRRRAKKRDSIWKSTSSLAETVRSQSASTASSPTPPALSAETSVVTASSPAAHSPSDSRSALLGAICAFDKNKLTRVSR